MQIEISIALSSLLWVVFWCVGVVACVAAYRFYKAVSAKAFQVWDGVLKRVVSLERKVSAAADAHANLANHAVPVVNQVGAGVAKAQSAWDVYCYSAIAIAVLALCKKLYERMVRAEKKKGDNKESKMLGEAEVFKLFDIFAVACFIPLFYQEGFAGAMRIWSSLKSLGHMIRTSCEGIRFFGSFFGTKNDIGQFAGIGYVEELAGAVDELSAKVKAPSAINFVSGGILDPSPPPPSPVDVEGEDPSSDSESYSDQEERKCTEEIKKGKKKNAHGDVVQCKACGDPSHEVPMPVAYAVNPHPVSNGAQHNAMWEHMRKLWTSQEEHSRLAQLKQVTEEKPWMLPCIVIVLFAGLLMVIRILRKSKDEKESKQAGSDKAKDRKPKAKKDQKNSPSDEKERKNSNQKKGSRRPWVEYDPLTGEPVQYFEDESGALYRRATKAEAMQENWRYEHPMDISMNRDVMPNKWTGGMPIPKDKKEAKAKGVFVKKTFKSGFIKVDQKEAKDQDVVLLPITLIKTSGKCTGKADCKCGRFHMQKKKAERDLKKQLDKQQKENSQKPQAQKPKVDKPESMHNGPQFEMKNPLECVGWAVCGAFEQCFVLCCNAILVSKHLFKEGGEKVVFYHPTAGSVEMKVSDGKQVAHDQMAFQMPVAWREKKLRQLRLARVLEGEKVALCCYNSRENVQHQIGATDQGFVTKIVSEKEGEEYARAKYSSKGGNSGGAVVNTHGKLVGWHCAGGESDNAFIPVTVTVATKLGSHF